MLGYALFCLSALAQRQTRIGASRVHIHQLLKLVNGSLRKSLVAVN